MRVSRHRRPPLTTSCLVILLAAAGCGRAEAPAWRSLESGLELHQLAGEEAEAPLTLVRLPLETRTRLRVRRHDGSGAQVSELAAEPAVLAAVNANFFDAEGRALGWVVADGREHSPLGRAGWGVLSVDETGAAWIRRPSAVEAGDPVRQAVQAGPLLVEGGRANPGLKSQTARRVFVGLDAEGRLVLGSTGLGRADAPTLAARLARPVAEGGAGLVEVLNLDGGSSAQFYVRGGRDDGDLIEPGLARVPVLLTIETVD